MGHMGETDNLITVVPVMYRDAANYKRCARIILDGAITGSQIDEVRQGLDEGEFFVPEQLGMEHLGWSSGWSSYPCEDDHGWHEMNLSGIEVVPGHAGAFIEGVGTDVATVTQFLARIAAVAAAGWRPTDPASGRERKA